MKKLVLFDSFSKKEEMIYDSILYFNQENNNLNGLVFEDQSFLPNEITSIYDTYIGEWEFERMIKDIYYAFIPLPNYYIVEPTFERGSVYDMGQRKAEIYVRNPVEKRFVERVEWLKDDTVVRKDYYDRYGFVYKRDYFNKDGNLLETSWYTSKNKEVLFLNHSNRVFGSLMRNNNKKYYHEMKDWIKEYLYNIFNNYERVIITSNSQKDMLIENFNVKVIDCSFFENSDNATNSICFVSKETIKRIENKKTTSDILILTTSDQLESLEEIVSALPKCHFHVAAHTAFSQKIYALENKCNNVFLYSSIDEDELKKLFNKCALYLDINQSYSYPYSIEQAALYGLVIMKFNDIHHADHYFLDENVFSIDDIKQMIFIIQDLTGDLDKMKSIAIKQHQFHVYKLCQYMKGLLQYDL